MIASYHKGIVERGKDTGNTEDELSGTDLGTERNVFLNLNLACFLLTRISIYIGYKDDGWMPQRAKNNQRNRVMYGHGEFYRGRKIAKGFGIRVLAGLPSN
jgi:hypothetical protein